MRMPDHFNPDPNDSSRSRTVSGADKLPPQLSTSKKVFLVIAWSFMLGSLIFLACQCVLIVGFPRKSVELTCWTYIAFVAFLAGLIAYFILKHKIRIHVKRKEDRSEVEALMQEALNLRPPILDSADRNNIEEIKNQIREEIRRLKDEVGPEGWTEYQVLTLKRLLIDIFSIDDLLARARSVLEELREYAEGPAFSYNSDLFHRWETEINQDINELKNDNKSTNSSVKRMRANVKSVYEHVADYRSNWSEGSTIVSAIRICGSVGAIIFLLLGIIHLLYPIGDSDFESNIQFRILHWGCLGVAGATTNVLIVLRNSDEVEVGNNDGEQELWRVVLGVPLGFVAGILTYAAIKGGLLAPGSVVPDLENANSESIYLSIIWAVGAGLTFERVFQRVRNIAENQGQ